MSYSELYNDPMHRLVDRVLNLSVEDRLALVKLVLMETADDADAPALYAVKDAIIDFEETV